MARKFGNKPPNAVLPRLQQKQIAIWSKSGGIERERKWLEKRTEYNEKK